MIMRPICFLCGAEMQQESELRDGEIWYFCENGHGRLSQAASYFRDAPSLSKPAIQGNPDWKPLKLRTDL